MVSSALSMSAKCVIESFSKKIGATRFSTYHLPLAVSLFDYVARTQSILPKETAQQIVNILSEYKLDLESIIGEGGCKTLAKEFAAVINDCFDFYSRSVRSGGTIEASTPKEVNAFIFGLDNNHSNGVIYTPFMGMAFHTLVDNKEVKFVGEEINIKTWALAQINIIANGSNATIKLGDSFSELKDPTTKFDKILLMPPFGLRDREKNEFYAVLDAVDNKLNEGGTLIALLPLNFTNSNGGPAFALRKTLMEKKYIVSIMTLPAVIGGMPIKPCVLVVKKERQEGALFLDFSKLLVKENYLRCFSYKSALEAIEQGNPEYGKYIPYSEIEWGNSLNLTPASKLYTLPETRYPVERLTNLVRVVHVGHVSNIEANFLTLDETVGDNKLGSIREFNSCLRVVKNGVKALPNKLALFRQPSLKFAITGDFDVSFDVPYVAPLGTEFFEITSDLVSKEYLEAALNQPFVMDQFEVQRRDRSLTAPFDYSEIMVPVPSNREQIKIIEQFTAEERQNCARLAEVYAKRAGIRLASSDLSHMIGAPMYKVGNAITLLEDILAGNDEGLETIAYLKDNLAYAERLIKANSADFSKYPKSRFSIVEFFQDYIRGWKNYGSKNFVINDFLWIDDDITIYGSKDAFKVMLDAILDNANRHAFRNTYSENHQVGISLDLIDEATEPKILLDITNNGIPMPQDYTLADFIESGNYGEDTGRSGLGGNHIYDIITSLGGEMEIVHLEEGTGFLFFIPVSL